MAKHGEHPQVRLLPCFFALLALTAAEVGDAAEKLAEELRDGLKRLRTLV